jgi:hypothetical protein
MVVSTLKSTPPPNIEKSLVNQAFSFALTIVACQIITSIVLYMFFAGLSIVPDSFMLYNVSINFAKR